MARGRPPSALTGGPDAGAVVVLAGGILDLNGYAATVTSLSSPTAFGAGGSITSSSPAQLIIDYNGASVDDFGGALEGSISLLKQGTGTYAQYGDGTYTGQTEIDVGTFQAASPFAVPTGGDLIVNAPGKLDLDGNGVTVGSLNGAGSASLTAAEDAVITNSSSSAAILEVGGNGNTSTFGGRIIDGVGTVELYVINCHQGFTLTSTANEYSGGTILNDADLILGNGTTDDMVQGNIQLTDEDSVVFNVVAGNTEEYSGSIYTTAGGPGQGLDCFVTKSGGGTLDFNASEAGLYYDSTTVSGGTLVLENSAALPANGGVTLSGNAIVDLGGYTVTAGLNLLSGRIGTLSAAAGGTQKWRFLRRLRSEQPAIGMPIST